MRRSLRLSESLGEVLMLLESVLKTFSRELSINTILHIYNLVITKRGERKKMTWSTKVKKKIDDEHFCQILIFREIDLSKTEHLEHLHVLSS